MKINSMINSIMNLRIMNRTKKQSTGKHSCRTGTDRIQLSRTLQQKHTRDTYPDGDVLHIRRINHPWDRITAEKITFAGGSFHGHL